MIVRCRDLLGFTRDSGHDYMTLRTIMMNCMKSNCRKFRWPRSFNAMNETTSRSASRTYIAARSFQADDCGAAGRKMRASRTSTNDCGRSNLPSTSRNTGALERCICDWRGRCPASAHVSAGASGATKPKLRASLPGAPSRPQKGAQGAHAICTCGRFSAQCTIKRPRTC